MPNGPVPTYTITVSRPELESIYHLTLENTIKYADKCRVALANAHKDPTPLKYMHERLSERLARATHYASLLNIVSSQRLADAAYVLTLFPPPKNKPTL